MNTAQEKRKGLNSLLKLMQIFLSLFSYKEIKTNKRKEKQKRKAEKKNINGISAIQGNIPFFLLLTILLKNAAIPPNISELKKHKTMQIKLSIL